MHLRLISLLGLFVFIGLAWLMSSRKRVIPWRIIVGGLALQFVFALLVLHTAPGKAAFGALGAGVMQLLNFVEHGTSFLFNAQSEIEPEERTSQLLTTFAFSALPTIIFFSSLMSVLYYVGLMQLIVKGAAWIMQKTLALSGAESLAAAANIFVGQTEAPLVVRPFIAGMTNSELNALMVGGFATISSGLLAAYAGMGIHPGHLITAAVISAPAALLIAKVMLPETETPQTLGSVKVDIPRQGVNVIEAAAIGASDGMKLALNVAAMLIAFLALLAMLDALIGALGSVFQQTWSLSDLLGYAFAPFAWLMGIETDDCTRAGELLGVKMVANEFIAYEQLGRWIKQGAEAPISERTQTILTYALSGFSNFGAIGIQIGGIGPLAPDRRSDLARLGLRAMLGGAIACCMTGCIAGLVVD